MPHKIAAFIISRRVSSCFTEYMSAIQEPVDHRVLDFEFIDARPRKGQIQLRRDIPAMHRHVLNELLIKDDKTPEDGEGEDGTMESFVIVDSRTLWDESVWAVIYTDETGTMNAPEMFRVKIDCVLSVILNIAVGFVNLDQFRTIRKKTGFHEVMPCCCYHNHDNFAVAEVGPMYESAELKFT